MWLGLLAAVVVADSLVVTPNVAAQENGPDVTHAEIEFWHSPRQQRVNGQQALGRGRVLRTRCRERSEFGAEITVQVVGWRGGADSLLDVLPWSIAHRTKKETLCEALHRKMVSNHIMPLMLIAQSKTLCVRLKSSGVIGSGGSVMPSVTQYYQTIGSTTTYIGNVAFGAAYVDTSPYPASGCTDSATPGNCITDAQIQAEISRVMALNHWTGGLNHIFFLFTSSGEGSCFDSSSTSCAYTQYCAYHGFIPGAAPVIYANMPYGNPTVCQTPGTPSPNGNVAADTAATAASHELTEAITDPLLNAWFTSTGEEIGDL
jgi:hypothetical protein